jgi:succinate dehydrogenase/fumarate reductase cytochrome b subunit
MARLNPIVFIRVFHRWSGIALILLVGAKILSGFTLSGSITLFSERLASQLHYSRWIDIPLLFGFLFHALYGIVKIGSARIARKNLFFWIMSVLGILLFLASFLFLFRP